MGGLLNAYRDGDLDRLLPSENTAPPTFGDVWDAARQGDDAWRRSDTRDLYAKRLGRTVVDALAERGRTTIDTGYGRRIAITPRNLTRDRAIVAERIWQEVAAERARDPEFLKDLADADAFEAAIIAARRGDYEEAEGVLADASGVGGLLAQFGGGFQSTLADPVTQITTALTLPIGGPIAGGIARRIGLSALREAALNTAATAPALVLTARNAAEIGIDYGAGEIAADLGMAAAVGGVFGGGFEAAGAGIDRGLARLSSRRIAAELRKLPEKTGQPLTQSQMDAVRMLEREADDLDASPYAPDSVADGMHMARLDEARHALENDEAFAFDPGDIWGKATEGFDPLPFVPAARAWVDAGESIRPDRMGEGLGLPAADARRVLERLASMPDSGLFMSRAGELRRIPRMSGPEDVIDFLARRGGLSQDNAHDLANVGDLAGMFVPRAGPILRRRGGMQLDEAGELLAEAGYFGGVRADFAGRVSEADVVALLDRASRQRREGRRIFPDEIQAEAQAGRAEAALREADAAARRDALDTMQAAFARESIELSDDEADAAYQYWRRYWPDSDDPLDALEAFMEDGYWEARLVAARQAGDDTPPPFFDEVETGDGGRQISGDDRGRGTAVGEPEGDGRSAGEAGTFREAAEDIGGAADTTEGLTSPLDLGEQVDPQAAARAQQELRMRADSPLRAGDRAEQADVDGLPMFDAERSPELFSDSADALTADAASGRAIAEFDDPDGAGAAAQTEHLLHDLRRALEDEDGGAALTAADETGLRQMLDELDGDEAALAAVRACL
ncbi:MAG: hypothetical protein WDA25_00955 [Paracoccaceae bacterium]